jgi:hypothetical protein
MADLETGMTRIHTNLDKLATTISNDVTGNVLLGLQGVGGVITQHNHDIAQLEDKLMQPILIVQEASLRTRFHPYFRRHQLPQHP